MIQNQMLGAGSTRQATVAVVCARESVHPMKALCYDMWTKDDLQHVSTKLTE